MNINTKILNLVEFQPEMHPVIDWANVYERLMSEFKNKRLIPHVILLSSFLVLGFVVGVYSSFNFTFFIIFIGLFVDYVFFGTQLLEIFTRKRPYVIEGPLVKRILKKINQEGNEYEEFYFLIDVKNAYLLDKNGLSPLHYPQKEGEQRLEVPHSMLLSLKAGQSLRLVCYPNDKVWGLVRDSEVIFIEE